MTRPPQIERLHHHFYTDDDVMEEHELTSAWAVIDGLIESHAALLEALDDLFPHITLEVECRKHGGNGEDYAELEALEYAAQEAVRKAKGA